MFGRDKKREATMEARLQAVELTLLAVLPVLPPESRAIVSGKMEQFAARAVSNGPPSSLVPAQHAQLYRNMLSERMQHMIEVMDGFAALRKIIAKLPDLLRRSCKLPMQINLPSEEKNRSSTSPPRTQECQQAAAIP